jgi:DNA processing protein
MTPTEAAALAILGVHNRRLAAAFVRMLTGRSVADEQDTLPAPEIWAEHFTRLRDNATAQLHRAAELGIAAIPLLDAHYPPLLAAIPDAPPLLWIKGEPVALQQPSIALVGSRAASPYGLALAARLAADLAAAGYVIVSGLARGIDSAAHAAALSAKGKTIAVLGCGLDRVYPSEHTDLAHNIQHAGAIVSEFPPGVPPLPHHFPMRNRIISGLALAVVVVEAPEKSGALITASAAAEHGRDVMVLPGPVTGGRNRGGHLLIRDGAKVVESADDILQELGALNAARRGSASEVELGQLPETADFTIDDVAERTGELPNVVLARLLDLELAGRIQRIGGGRFVRVLT